jgi:DNA-binding HxlR family transcriptional regulator
MLSTSENVKMIDDLLREATEVAGDRWVLLALAGLSEGSRRFGDLLADLPGIAPNVLIDRLRRMERQGLVVATPYSQRPRRYVYDLTESGRDLAAILPALSNWASRRGGGDPRRHTVCGTPVETREWCPNCRTVVDGTSVDENMRWV